MFEKGLEPVRDCHWYVNEIPPVAVAVRGVVPPTHSLKPTGCNVTEMPESTTAVAMLDVELAQELPTELTTNR